MPTDDNQILTLGIEDLCQNIRTFATDFIGKA